MRSAGNVRILKKMIIVRNDQENVWRSRKSRKGRQDTDKKNKIKRANNDPQNVTQKTKDRATRTPLKTSSELRCSGRSSSPRCNCDSCYFRKTNIKILIHIFKPLWMEFQHVWPKCCIGWNGENKQI